MQAPSHAAALPLQGPDTGTGDLQAGQAPASAPTLAVDSQALLQGHKAVTIAHNGALYRLQATKLGKLILTK